MIRIRLGSQVMERPGHAALGLMFIRTNGPSTRLRPDAAHGHRKSGRYAPSLVANCYSRPTRHPDSCRAVIVLCSTGVVCKGRFLSLRTLIFRSTFEIYAELGA